MYMLIENRESASLESSSLSAVAKRINDHHSQATRHATTAIEHARQAGELLNQAKALVAHGQWIGWLSDNCDVSPRQAQRYMKVANNWLAITKNDAASYLTIDDALSLTSEKSGMTTREAWAAKIEALPMGQALFGDFRHGFTIVFRSPRHPDYFHCYSYFCSDEFEGGEAQETQRPIIAEGMAWFLANAGMEPDEFTEVDDDGQWEHDIKATLPRSQDFYRQLRGAQ
jgi:hypothetical protein